LRACLRSRFRNDKITAGLHPLKAGTRNNLRQNYRCLRRLSNWLGRAQYLGDVFDLDGYRLWRFGRLRVGRLLRYSVPDRLG
jgi:hypothetical protein